MGFLGKLFGGEEHPPLYPGTPAAARFERHQEVVTAFAARLHDRLEVVPGEKFLYAFIGRPPEAFGIAWFEGSEEHNLKTLMKTRGLNQEQLGHISSELRQAYLRSKGEPRFMFQAGKKKVIVTPSVSLEKDLLKIIHEVAD
ncbi:MAG TPA: hypothetical protein VIV57_04210 [Anaeromyxobacter sp.]